MLAVSLPIPPASGHVLPSPWPSTGSSWVMPVTVMVTGSWSGSTTTVVVEELVSGRTVVVVDDGSGGAVVLVDVLLVVGSVLELLDVVEVVEVDDVVVGGSIVQVDEHPSPSATLWSSHSSPGSRSP